MKTSKTDDFSPLRHDARNHLTVLLAYTDLLAKKIKITKDPDIDGLMKKMKKKIQQLINLLNRMR